MRSVAIVDYGMGNLGSVRRAVEECGGSPLVTSDPRELETATAIILPGVGAFPAGMQNLRKCGLVDVLHEQVVERKIPFLGLCLGMQLMAEKGLELEQTAGLGWISGEVKRLQSKEERERIPHVGWDEVIQTRPSPLFADISSGKDFYFVHSYHFECSDPNDVIAWVESCGGFVAAIARANLFGVQFHPEKSQKPGFQLLRNFLSF